MAGKCPGVEGLTFGERRESGELRERGSAWFVVSGAGFTYGVLCDGPERVAQGRAEHGAVAECAADG